MCGSATCRGVNEHGVFRAQLAQSAGDVALSIDPIIMYGRTVGHYLFAWWVEDGQVVCDATFIAEETRPSRARFKEDE